MDVATGHTGAYRRRVRGPLEREAGNDRQRLDPRSAGADAGMGHRYTGDLRHPVLHRVRVQLLWSGTIGGRPNSGADGQNAGGASADGAGVLHRSPALASLSRNFDRVVWRETVLLPGFRQLPLV